MTARFKIFSQCVSSIIVLAAISVFIVVSCHTERFTSYPYVSAQNSCQEHTLSAFTGAMKFIDDAILPSQNLGFLLPFIIVAFLVIFPRDDAGFLARNLDIRKRNKRLRWVWARSTPFVSNGYTPYFAAQRDP